MTSQDNEIQLLNDHHSVSSSDSVQMIMSPPNLQGNLFGTNKTSYLLKSDMTQFDMED